MKTNMIKKIIFWSITLFFAAVIFFFSAQNGAESGGLSGGITKWLLELFPSYKMLGSSGQTQVYDLVQELLRSGAHWFIFLCLGMSAALLAKCYPLRRPFFFAMLGCVLYAVFDELHQGLFSPGRACEFVDLLKDWTGSGMGIAMIWLCSRRRKKKELA